MHPPLPETVNQDLLGGAPLSVRTLGCHARDGAISLAQRVGGFGLWLTSGILPASGLVRAMQEGDAKVCAWNAGKLKVSQTTDPMIVTLRSTVPFGLREAYRWAPIVVAEATINFQRKLTVAQFETGWLNMASLRQRLNDIEPGWGGSATLLGSPQGASSKIELEALVRAVTIMRLHHEEHLSQQSVSQLHCSRKVE
jgi:hypothetical protein